MSEAMISRFKHLHVMLSSVYDGQCQTRAEADCANVLYALASISRSADCSSHLLHVCGTVELGRERRCDVQQGGRSRIS